MAKKIEYTEQYVPIEDALTQFTNEEDLLSALKEGALEATGRLAFYDDLKQGRRTHIIPEEWCDCTWKNRELHGVADHEGHTDPYFIADIWVMESSLNALKEANNVRFRKNKAGAKPKYDWEEFFKILVKYHHHKGAPETLSQWVSDIQSSVLFVEFWEKSGGKITETKGKEAGDTTLKDKLRDLFDNLKEAPEDDDDN